MTKTTRQTQTAPTDEPRFMITVPGQDGFTPTIRYDADTNRWIGENPNGDTWSHASTLRGAERTARTRFGKHIVLTPAQAPASQGRAARTWDATAADTHTCAGACGETKPAKSFPTTGKDGQRGVECRSCRDARKAA